jgi:hypothetical protein
MGELSQIWTLDSEGEMSGNRTYGATRKGTKAHDRCTQQARFVYEALKQCVERLMDDEEGYRLKETSRALDVLYWVDHGKPRPSDDVLP